VSHPTNSVLPGFDKTKKQKNKNKKQKNKKTEKEE